jgi:hypothetical protein
VKDEDDEVEEEMAELHTSQSLEADEASRKDNVFE